MTFYPTCPKCGMDFNAGVTERDGKPVAYHVGLIHSDSGCHVARFYSDLGASSHVKLMNRFSYCPCCGAKLEGGAR